MPYSESTVEESRKCVTMTDVFSPEKRSEIMSRIKGADTKPELIVRRALHRLGFRFRLHASNLPGKPDIVLPKYKAAVFVNGCFWHSHPGCRRATVPKTRSEYWQVKLRRNRDRDKRSISALRGDGWDVLVVWECETGDVQQLSSRLTAFLGEE
ncbi:unnamed protein product, partial [marine sediment metagenome]